MLIGNGSLYPDRVLLLFVGSCKFFGWLNILSGIF